MLIFFFVTAIDSLQLVAQLPFRHRRYVYPCTTALSLQT